MRVLSYTFYIFKNLYMKYDYADLSLSPSIIILIFVIYGRIDVLFAHPVVVDKPGSNICPLLFIPADRPLVSAS